MTKVKEIGAFLEAFAPVQLAEDWDNVGLLVGDNEAEVAKVMTCLTITPDSAREAIEGGVGMIVAHHPLPFHSFKRVTTDNTPGRLLWQLIQAGIAIYSPHTAFDSAAAGINQRLAEGLGLADTVPLAPLPDEPGGLGAGRRGRFSEPKSLLDFVAQVKNFLQIESLQVVGQADSQIQFPAVACGSAGQFLATAKQSGCDALVTGETNFHTCLEAEAGGIALVLPGHYASERFAVEALADVLSAEFASLEIWASNREKDPLRWV